MKITTKISCLLLFWMGFTSQSEGNAVYEEAITRFSTEPSPENLMKLAGHLRGIARYREGYKESEDYHRIQNILLSTPGHAKYFAEEIERLIANPRSPNDDVRERRWYLRDTLVHLPSPETIQVLGSYLHDERYSLDPNKNNSGAYGPTSPMVATALRNIGLRESEEYIRTQGSSLTSTLDMESLRRWWELVKSGERTFSFKGQDVEYRFKPDGTWETIPIANPPDDGPKPMEAEPDESVKREASSQPATPVNNDTSTPRQWVWIPIVVVLVAGLFGYRMFRKRES